LENDNAAIHTEERHSQLKECFVLLLDFNKNKKIIHKPNKGLCFMFIYKIINYIIILKNVYLASSRKKRMIGSENNKENLSM